MKKHLKRQIEKILDEGRGASRSVIVQMAPAQAEHEEAMRVSKRVAERRAVVMSARELLPPPAKVLNRRKTKKVRKELLGLNNSMASQMAATCSGRSREQLKTEGQLSLAPLMGSDTFKACVAIQRKKKSRRQYPKAFWSSSSVAMNITKDLLASLPDDVPDVVGVFENRKIKLPPVTEVSESALPRNVVDNKTSAWGVQAIGAMSVWGAYGAEGQGTKVAVLDTGVDPNHKDLVGRMNASDFAEFDASGNRVTGANARDTGQHGTHVAGTVAGGDADGQYIGVAPQAKIAGGIVLPGGGGTDAQILGGIEWAIERGVDVINLSLGGLSLSPDVFDTYTQAFLTANQSGIPVAVAIGNDGSQTSGSPGNDILAFAVGATDSSDYAAGFSGGRTQIIRESNVIRNDILPLVYTKPDVSAPGVAVKSAIPGNKYATWNGTSMATPHVAGAIALLLSATSLKDQPASERAFLIQDILLGSTEELGEAGLDARFGFGRIDVLKAVGYAWELGYGA